MRRHFEHGTRNCMKRLEPDKYKTLIKNELKMNFC